MMRGLDLHEIPDWACDNDTPHGPHLWSDGKLGMECPGFSTSARIDAPKEVTTYRCIRDITNNEALDAGLQPYPYVGPCMQTCCKPWEPERQPLRTFLRLHRTEVRIGVVVSAFIALAVGSASLDSDVTTEDTRRPAPMEVEIDP